MGVRRGGPLEYFLAIEITCCKQFLFLNLIYFFIEAQRFAAEACALPQLEPTPLWSIQLLCAYDGDSNSHPRVLGASVHSRPAGTSVGGYGSCPAWAPLLFGAG